MQELYNMAALKLIMYLLHGNITSMGYVFAESPWYIFGSRSNAECIYYPQQKWVDTRF